MSFIRPVINGFLSMTWQTSLIASKPGLNSAHEYAHRFRQLADFSTRLIPPPSRSCDIRGHHLDHLYVEQITAKHARTDKALLLCHGGGHVWGSPKPFRNFAWRLSRATQATVFIPDYRKAPEHLYPCANDDIEMSYRYLLDKGYNAESIAFYGDSAGGHLALATLLRLKDKGCALPASICLVSPLTDLTVSGQSTVSNIGRETMLCSESLKALADLYGNGHDLNNPELSPLFGDLAGLPPIQIHVSDIELLLSDSTRLHERITNAGGVSELHLKHKLSHDWPLMAYLLPEGRRTISLMGEFYQRHF